MVCSSCGEKPKKTCNEFTKSVIEINNPETLVLLRKVVVPASMGTEEQVPAAIGKYHNVILYYEANKHIYLYSSDGIPTYIETEIPEALLDRIDDLETGERNLQQEIDDLKNSPDVVDIVNTYSDLQAYDTSSLGDKDIIRVLNDETHNGESSYYRWNKQSETWTFIGTDSGRSIKTLTSADYNWNHDTQTETNPNCIAIWKLPSGIYYSAYGVLIAYNKNFSISYEAINIVSKHSNNVAYISVRDSVTSCGTVSTTGTPSTADGRIIQWNNVVNNLTETGYYKVLDARQGKVLKDLIDALPTPPTVVQNTGQSTTDVMSQKAVTDALAGAGGDITKFYFDESDSAPSAHINIYKDKAMTQLATSADVWNAKDTGFELVGLEVASSDPLEVYEYNVYPAIFLQDESMNESATNVNWCTYSYGSISMWNMQNNLSYATYTNTTIPTVVQATGTSTTDVMSQDAVTNALNALPTGGVTVLTTADYNWPTNNPTGIAPWLLDIGWYTAEDGVKIFQNPATSAVVSWYYGRSFYVGIGTGPSGTEYTRTKYIYRIGEYGFSPAEGDGAYAWIDWFAKDNSGMQTMFFPSLSALSERVIRKAGAPTASTVGKVGTLCEDTANGDLYICTDDTNPYVWEEVGGGPATFTTNEWNALWA